MPDERQALRIGEWRVDPDLDELSRGGQTIRLEPRTMRLLLYLAAHAGRVVDVQHLLDEVWPNVVVTQGSVYQAIAELRRILGDDREHPSYIENLPRRGYRLIAAVALWEIRSAAAMDPTPPARGVAETTIRSVGAERQLASAGLVSAGAVTRRPVMPTGVSRPGAVLGAIALAVVIIAGFATGGIWRARHVPVTGARVGGKTEILVTPVTFAPPPHSIAVLPFVNISGDASQEYFSDGLTEELLNSLSRINELQVAARTSSFSFQGEHPDIATVARRLNVASVLEGSVRRSGHTVRITAQLDNAVTGFHIWSQTYDRDLEEVLKLQTEIATAVAGSLKVTLLGDAATKIELGGTHIPAAFDAFLRGRKAAEGAGTQDAIAAYTEAIRLDPNYALALANRSISLTYSATEASRPDVRESFNKAESDARNALALAPDLVDGHLALAYNFEAGLLDFPRANQEYERALALAPGNARVLRDCATFAVPMGRTERGIAAARRAVVLDPLNDNAHHDLGWTLYYGRQNREAIAAYQDTLALNPDDSETYALRGLAYYALGDLENARASCESKPDHSKSQQCLALTYDKLGRHADAEVVLAQVRAARGDRGAYLYATVEAQWGNVPKALEWLDTAMRLRDPALEFLKTDPLLDPLRKEPRFQAIERELAFPK